MEQEKPEEAAERNDECVEERQDQPVVESPAGKRTGFSVREVVLSGVAVVAIVAAAVGFTLYAGAQVPADSAAKVDDTYITEQSVSDWIAQYRTANSLSDDATFASALLSQNLNVTTFRQNAVNQLALAELVNKRAAELGATPTDEKIQEQLDAAKASFSFGDDEVWAETMEMYGLDEETLKSQYKTNLAQRAVCEADVARREASDDEVLAYAQKYLAGSTQKHASRIVFSGDGASTRAQECYQALTTAQAEGGVDAQAFAEFAKIYSDEEGVENTGGSYAWSGSQMDSATKELLEGMEAGTFSGPESNDADDTVSIVFCDEVYVFPSSSEFTSLPEDVPEALMDEIAEAASEALWENDSNAYLATLLADAKITYYPVPDGASYDVDMSLASSKQ